MAVLGSFDARAVLARASKIFAALLLGNACFKGGWDGAPTDWAAGASCTLSCVVSTLSTAVTGTLPPVAVQLVRNTAASTEAKI